MVMNAVMLQGIFLELTIWIRTQSISKHHDVQSHLGYGSNVVPYLPHVYLLSHLGYFLLEDVL